MKSLWKTAEPKAGELTDIYADRAYKEVTPIKRPRKKKQAIPDRICAGSVSGIYDGADLKQPPGIPDSRFVAFKLPSLRHGKRVYPEG